LFSSGAKRAGEERDEKGDAENGDVLSSIARVPIFEENNVVNATVEVHFHGACVACVRCRVELRVAKFWEHTHRILLTHGLPTVALAHVHGQARL
jgi:hypothetical protein